jgi:cyclic beta-1,2-glucan synthetase
MYRVALEGILGFHLQGTDLRIDPCIPRAWPGFTMTFRYRTATYEIAVENPSGVSRGVVLTELDGQVLPADAAGLAPLTDDGQTHRLRVVLG